MVSSDSETNSSDDDKTQFKRHITIVKPQSIIKTETKRKLIRRDRFYDKSRNIPNSIYFGDEKVSLHDLHNRWDSDQELSSSTENNSTSTKSSLNVHKKLKRFLTI